jgi:transcriptional regulator with XRE-family HTH domain
MEHRRFPGDSRAAVMARLTVTREAYGWSQAEMCRRLGITPQSWSHYEKLRVPVPTHVAANVCRQTGVTLDWVYFGSEALLPQIVVRYIQATIERNRRERRA